LFEQNGIHAASFRDPSGFLFYKDRVLHRQVNRVYKDNYDHLIRSGLHSELAAADLLIQHEEVEVPPPVPNHAYKILKPEPVPFISYPYEWCFSQLKDAALVTLRIQKSSLEKDMVLKDASAYNIQFHRGKPILIDTLSFERYRRGEPWIAYRQFCQHFLAPLALMSYLDIGLQQLLRVHIDGIPLNLAARLLPKRTRLSLPLFLHIHLHAWSQAKYCDKQVEITKIKPNVSSQSMLGLIDSLESAIRKLDWCPGKTEWGDYYQDTNYSEGEFNHKKQSIGRFIDLTDAKTVWDFGANNGLFTRIASNKGLLTVAFDIDPVAVENNYRESARIKDEGMLPLLLDLTNPSPGLGWMSVERDNLLDRGPADLALALALVHHLAISNNIPFHHIASFFYAVSQWLIIEFVPKDDSQVQRLLTTRQDIFADYTQESFEHEFSRYFNLIASEKIHGSGRILYLFNRV